MTTATSLAIAQNRFGLGLRGDEAAPGTGLVDQFPRYDPRPPAIAAVPGSAAMVVRFRDYQAQQIAARMAQMQAAMAAERPAGIASPTVSPPAPGKPPRSLAQKALRGDINAQFRESYADAARARIIAALNTTAPFAERLVHFWANHFAVSADKLETLALAGTMEFEAIRPNIAGRFVDLLLAVERHPAMLVFLDQAKSIGPDSALGQAARNRRGRKLPGLNENLGREILELHTLGVGGGYTQADVQELARALTGWSIGGFTRQAIAIEAPEGQFAFQPGWHQPGDRIIMGRRYREQGEAQAAAILGDLAVHPATAHHLATKLARHFVADVPPPALVDRLARAHVESGGDLMAMYRLLVAAPEAWATPMPKFKTPWDWTISALRGIGARDAPDLKIVGALAELGQPIWRPGSPAGWDDIAASWAAPDALLRRVEIAERIASLVGDRIDARLLAPRLLPGVLSPATAAAIANCARPQQGLALLLAAPEFLRR